MDKVLLIQPQAYSKYPGMPMGLIHTASCLEKDYDVMAIDLVSTPMNDGQLSSLIESYNPNFVLIGGTSPSLSEAYHIATLVKKINRQIIIIKGGPHEKFYPYQVAKHDEIDFVLSGDGETSSLLIKKIKEGKRTDKVFFEKIADLSNTSLPNRQLLYSKNPSYYDFLDKPTAQIRMSRGCIFNCVYCSQGKYREYSNEYLFRDLENIEKQGFKAIYWDDAIFTLKRKRLYAILARLKDYGFDMGCITRVGINTDLGVFEDMYSVGFRDIWFGLESGDEEIRESWGRKSVGVNEVKNAVYNAKKAGLNPFVNIIIGDSMETDATIQRTIDALNFIQPFGVSASVLTIYPVMKECKPTIYETPINRDKRLMIFDEGYGGYILIDPGVAERWYYEIKEKIEINGIKLLDFEDCKTPKYWELPPEPYR